MWRRSSLASQSKAARIGARFLPAVAVLGIAVQLARGAFKPGELSFGDFAALLALLLGTASRAGEIRRRVRACAPTRSKDEVELAAGLVAATYVLVGVGGAPLFPLVYLVIAVLVSRLTPHSVVALVFVALGLEGAAALGRATPASTLAGHVIFLLLFAAVYHVVLRVRLAAARNAERRAVAQRIKEVEERARIFRLVNAESEGPELAAADHRQWLIASVKEIEGALGACLDIAETALRAHTCAAFLLGPDERFLKLYDCRSRSERVRRDLFSAGEGIVGGVVRRRLPIRMSSASGVRGITYYDEGPLVRSVLAVPIIESAATLRGVLIADRLAEEAFSDDDEKLLVTLAAEVLRSIEIERVMGDIRKTRDEKDRFFRAIEELNRAGNPDQVFVAVLESTRLLAELDFCAVTLVADEPDGRMHRVVRVAGHSGNALEGKCFPDNNGLVATAVRYGTPLPGREVASLDRQVVFDSALRLAGLEVVKIFPLLAGERTLGTLVVGAHKASALRGEVVRMMQVIAIQAAQAILRAELFEQMERMATTDALTGLVNRRAFQAKVNEVLAQARRYEHRSSFIVADIDHFKSVNDTYGHATGDLVLKGVARILREKARDTDVVARYGGEEFAIAMPQTDGRGAEIIAERIRQTVLKQVFPTAAGPLQVTLSLGVATYPDHGEDGDVLIDLADQALYDAKKRGRNQSVTVAQLWSRRRPLAQAANV